MSDAAQRRHPIEWTDGAVARFWDHASGSESFRAVYFSRMVGRGIVNFLRRTTALEGRILDYGCGPGYLAAALVDAGVACEGVDFSPASVEEANRRLAGHPLWRGAVAAQGTTLDLPAAAFDGIVCLETIEHVTDPRLDPFLAELRRLLRPGGWLFLTTPHDERLSDAETCCPECGAVFHRMQHVRSFACDTLAALFASRGFETGLCAATDFSRFQDPLWPGWADLTPRRLARIAWSTACRACDTVTRRRPGAWVRQYLGRGRNLFWLGTRAG